MSAPARWSGIEIVPTHEAGDGMFGRSRGPSASDAPTVLFVCVHNAGRSQMAAALLERHAGEWVQVRW
jgi:hypothetical protein